MREPDRTRDLAWGSIFFLVVVSVLLGGLSWLMSTLGGFFAIIGYIVVIIWLVFLWRWFVNFIGLMRGEW